MSSEKYILGSTFTKQQSQRGDGLSGQISHGIHFGNQKRSPFSSS
jgi:hypothetical protein